jgi:hypothetical protein
MIAMKVGLVLTFRLSRSTQLSGMSASTGFPRRVTTSGSRRTLRA